MFELFGEAEGMRRGVEAKGLPKQLQNAIRCTMVGN